MRQTLAVLTRVSPLPSITGASRRVVPARDTSPSAPAVGSELSGETKRGGSHRGPTGRPTGNEPTSARPTRSGVMVTTCCARPGLTTRTHSDRLREEGPTRLVGQEVMGNNLKERNPSHSQGKQSRDGRALTGQRPRWTPRPRVRRPPPARPSPAVCPRLTGCCSHTSPTHSHITTKTSSKVTQTGLGVSVNSCLVATRQTGTRVRTRVWTHPLTPSSVCWEGPEVTTPGQP